jgi:hypothetical protein
MPLGESRKSQRTTGQFQAETALEQWVFANLRTIEALVKDPMD